jgi:hypothetical protein
MELDILRHTGCKWSRIIYAGFRGYIRPQDKHDMLKSSSDRMNEDLQGVKTGASHLLSLSPNENESVCDSFIRSFNQEYNKIADGDGLRSTSNQSMPANVKKVNDDLSNLSYSSKKESNKFNPFTNEKIQQEYNSNTSANSIV